MNKSRLQFTFYILHFTLSLFIISCTTSPLSHASLSGTCALINDSGNPSKNPIDYSGIGVSLYSLVELDTTISRINNQYPQIGVQINQHTDFDHREQTIVYSTETKADGSFMFSNIEQGKYNLVFEKEGWGWRYIYEINISAGENKLRDLIDKCVLNKQTSAMKDAFYDISLFPEISIPEDINQYFSQNLIVNPFHHLVIKEDAIFLPSSYLELKPNSTCRINPTKTLKIYGDINFNGTENQMISFTVNSNVLKNESYNQLNPNNLFNYIEIDIPENTTEISWFKLNYTNNGLITKTHKISSSIFCNGFNGLETNEELYIESSFFYNLKKGLILKNDTSIENIILNNCFEAIGIIENNSIIENSYLLNSFYGVRPFRSEASIIQNCDFLNNSFAISLCASNTNIKFNNFYTQKRMAIDMNRNYVQGTISLFCNPTISYNNFYINSFTVSGMGFNKYYDLPPGTCFGSGINTNVSLLNNYWKVNDIDSSIIDNEEYNDCPEIYFTPIFNPISNAGISN